ncbi:MAG: hypothetical protein L6Q38_11310, partial [Nitrospira sp.]|nr:hypothetical protein [Nitrospira sp.]
MASDRQVEANRQNALRSTGPTSPAGKARSSKNAMRHGLRSKDLVLSWESAKDFDRLAKDLEREYRPATATERILLSRLLTCIWRLRRIVVVEHRALDGTESTEVSKRTSYFLAISKHEAGLDRFFHRALRELERVQAERKAREVSNSGENGSEPASNG